MVMYTTPAQSNSSVLIKIEAAINAHDIDRFVSGFANEFVGEQPVQSERNFTGAERV